MASSMVPSLGLIVILSCLLYVTYAGDLMRKSIVYDKNTPDVFYCPQEKPSGFAEKILVKSRPLSRLCQFGGRKPLPEDYKSDCYNDVDESDFACKEKKRIMMRLKSSESAETTNSGSHESS